MCLAQGQHGDMNEDRTPTSRYGVRRSTTRPPCFQQIMKCLQIPRALKSCIISLDIKHGKLSMIHL